MVINENNAQLNSFVKGMNSDTAYDQLDNSSYVFAKNIRITNNDIINSDISADNYSSFHEGVVAPLPIGPSYKASGVELTEDDHILATDSIGEYGVVISKKKEGEKTYINIYRYTINNEQLEDGGQIIGELWCKFDVTEKAEGFKKVESVSTVLYQELESVIKLYIATGVYPIFELRIDNTHGKYNITDVDYFINNRILPKYPVYIENKIGGQLTTSQVQYTYRYYNKFETSTQLAPLTNKIQVIDPNRNNETGNAQDTKTSIGFTLKIRKINEYDFYNRIQIYRLSYIKPGENAEVELIYDGDITSTGSDFLFNDVGATPLAKLTMEEFSSMQGLVIIPKVIEQNAQYLFASNIKDDTIIQNVRLDSNRIYSVGGHGTDYSVILDDAATDSSVGIIPVQSSSTFNTTLQNYFKSRNINPSIPTNSYNDIFTSSLLRSLRRGETYNYGIVYYDKYGRRTNVLELGDISYSYNRNADSGQELEFDATRAFCVDNGKLYAYPIGVNIRIPTLIDNDTNQPIKDVIGCQIVRRSSKPIYQKTLLQVAVARPIRQALYNNTLSYEVTNSWGKTKPNVPKKDSPYYPIGFLWSGVCSISPGLYIRNNYTRIQDIVGADYSEEQYYNGKLVVTSLHDPIFMANSLENLNLFQIFSSEIDFRRDDVMSTLKTNNIKLHPIGACGLQKENNSAAYNSSIETQLEKIQTIIPTDGIGDYISETKRLPGFVDNGNIYRWAILQDADLKTKQRLVFPLYQALRISVQDPVGFPKRTGFPIKSVKDVKIPEWNDGFSNLQPEGDTIAAGGIKKYKQFETSIGEFTFNNWISFALYDCKISNLDNQPNMSASSAALFLSGDMPRSRYEEGLKSAGIMAPDDNGTSFSYGERRSWQGPGTSCFLINIDNLGLPYALRGSSDNCVTAICNIEHEISSIQNEPDEFIQYFGFGNYFPLKDYYIDDGTTNNNNAIVFDGDIYITPHELSTMYKAYDFTSYDTLQSMQITNYVPLESKVNTFFDYGMNLLNTNSYNLMSEPGSIDGVATQDRPVHQYNQIYSSNDESNDVFTLIKEENDNNFKQRTYYSEPKTNGEYIDNFMIFKPAAFIDVDGKYGEITHLLTDKNILYYWQEHAFGKFSVNERSLITDQNGNTIMLGQAGILSRNDYISTKYGMRMYDFCATTAEEGVYWVDVNNKAIVAANGNSCSNIGELLNVQNIVNSKISTKIPRIDYDIQNNELICKCLTSDNKDDLESVEQLIFNLKLKVATSIYESKYLDIISIKNHLYEFRKEQFTKHNYLKSIQEYFPMKLSFIVNQSASTTKVFDSQQIVPINRKEWNQNNKSDYTEYFETAEADMKFETDLNSTTNSIQPYTDREGNIIYNIPRFGDGEYGNRLRGKWMKVDFTANKPDQYTTISHVITKFRQSYS